MKKSKKTLAKVVPLVLMVAIVGSGVCGSLIAMNGTSAFFTDKDDFSINTKSGTLDLKLTDNTENNNLDPDNDGIINPGDYKPIKLNVANVGEKSMDVRVVLTLKSTKDISKYTIANKVNLSTGSSDTRYPAVESVVELKNATGKNYQLVSEKTIDTHTKQYILNLGTLNGSAETETGVTKTADDYDLQFYFDRLADKSYMGDNVTLDCTVYGIQHRNALDSDWDSIISTSTDENPVETSVTLDVQAFKDFAMDNGRENVTTIMYSSEDAPEDSTNISYDGDNLSAKVVDSKIVLYTKADKIKVSGNMDEVFADFSSLDDISALSKWDVSNATNMYGAFKNCTALSSTDIEPLKNWNVSRATNMSNMFRGCSGLDNLSALENWDVSKTTDMSDIFEGCTGLTDIRALSGWDVFNVTDMSGVFNNCSKLKDISILKNWNVSNVKNMSCMFKGSAVTSTDIEALKNWNVSRVTDMSGLFQECPELTTLDAISDWNVYGATNMDNMFYGCSKLDDISKLINWNSKISNVNRMSMMFYGCGALSDIDALSGWNVSSVTNMSGMFYGCSNLSNINALENWNVSSVNDISAMFQACTQLTSSDIGALKNWNISSATNMSGTFNGCSSLTNVDALKNWDVSNVTNMGSLFSGCTALNDISALSGWSVSNVTSMSGMFKNCAALTSVDALSGWDVSKTRLFSNMFNGCKKLGDATALNGWSSKMLSNATKRDMFKDTAITAGKFPTWYKA